jgi:hypothetical protein
MYDQKTNTCKERIVSIYQPHVRPILRGKQHARVEFGSKLGVSLDNGFAVFFTLLDRVNKATNIKNSLTAPQKTT